jgi:hypothetical protein
LKDELQWPDAEKDSSKLLFFLVCLMVAGVADVKEYHVVKYLDLVKERRSWSGKKKD